MPQSATDFSPGNADGGESSPTHLLDILKRQCHRVRVDNHPTGGAQRDMLRFWSKTNQGSNPPFNASCLGAIRQVTNFSALEFFSSISEHTKCHVTEFCRVKGIMNKAFSPGFHTWSSNNNCLCFLALQFSSCQRQKCQATDSLHQNYSGDLLTTQTPRPPSSGVLIQCVGVELSMCIALKCPL